jgi:hypothetical protein
MAYNPPPNNIPPIKEAILTSFLRQLRESVYQIWFQLGSGTGIFPTMSMAKTISSTTGAQTINKPSGSVIIASAASSLVVTNSLVDANSVILACVASNDATLKSVSVDAATGSFTIYGNAAATANTRVNFMVSN